MGLPYGQGTANRVPLLAKPFALQVHAHCMHTHMLTLRRFSVVFQWFACAAVKLFVLTFIAALCFVCCLIWSGVRGVAVLNIGVHCRDWLCSTSIGLLCEFGVRKIHA